jgi:hypothetical protein
MQHFISSANLVPLNIFFEKFYISLSRKLKWTKENGEQRTIQGNLSNHN